ncbi:MAG: hypothetical protein U0U69_15915 [Acidimicrobiia bacterium]
MRLMYRVLSLFGISMAFAGIVYAFCTFLRLSGWKIVAVYLIGLVGIACLALAWAIRGRVERRVYLVGVVIGVTLLVIDLIFAFLIADYDNRGLNKSNLMGSVLLIATGVFCWFIAIMMKAAPAMEYMSKHPEAKIDRGADFSAPKDTLALPPPPKGVHIPGPSVWPVLIAASAALIGIGLVFKMQVNGLIVAGIVLAVVTGGGWFRQAWRESTERTEHREHEASEH